MAFYKFVLQSTEGPVFITTKDTLLLIKKKLVVSIALSKVCDRIIMLI